ncbi:MAG: hypothetical protein IJF49_08445 [Clostridia bacterium]|nr:hypothetical protein [Clostridia bacterium]
MDNVRLLDAIGAKIAERPLDAGAYEDFYHICLDMVEDEHDISVCRGKWLAGTLADAVPRALRAGQIPSRLVEVHRKALKLCAVDDFDSYLQFVEWARDPEKRFYAPRRPIMHDMVVRSMQGLADGELDLLTVSLPPGTGKSTLGIFFLSWMMGRNPDAPNLASAHADMLTRSFYDGVMQIIRDPEYLWGEVFPGLIVATTNAKEETVDLGKPHRFSSLTCRAINASLTGATRCEGILYCDDLCSGIEEAMSRERLDKLWMTYTNDLKSRKKLGAKELHIATRWSVYDVIGRLEKQYGGSDRARFIAVPATNDDGESNFNYAYGVGFDRAYFEDMRSNLDSASYDALFMQRPIEREGVLYPQDELRRYFELPPGEPDAIIAICDTKDRGKDYGFLPVGYVWGNDYYIDDCVCDNGQPGAVEARFVDILLKHRVQSARFESNAAGGKIAEKIQLAVKERGGAAHITTRHTTENKETKIIVNSQWVKEHCLFRAEGTFKPSDDYGRMMRMLTTYTMTGKNPHDDVPDGMAMFAQYAQSFTAGNPVILRRPF